jgi:hypothetical protein
MAAAPPLPALTTNVGNTIHPPTNLQVTLGGSENEPLRTLNISFSTSQQTTNRFYHATLLRYDDGSGLFRRVYIDAPLETQFGPSSSPTSPVNMSIASVDSTITYYLRLRTIIDGGPPNGGTYCENWVGPIAGNTTVPIQELKNLDLTWGLVDGAVKLQWGFPSQFIEVRENDINGTVLNPPNIIDNTTSPNTNTAEYPLETTIGGFSPGTFTLFLNILRNFNSNTGLNNFNDSQSLTFTIEESGGGGEVDISDAFSETPLVRDDFTNASSKLTNLLDLANSQASVLVTRSQMRQKMISAEVTSFKAIRSGTSLQNVLATKLAGSEIENFTNVKHIGILPNQTVSLAAEDVTANLPLYLDADIGDTFTISYDGSSYTILVASSSEVTINGVTYNIGNTITLGSTNFRVIGFGSVVLNPLPEPIPCFLKGTRVLTPKGYKAIETFKNGDLIVTADNRFVPVTLSKKTVKKTTNETAPYRIPRNFFGRGMPSTEVELSPHHAVMIRSNVWAVPRMLAVQDKSLKQFKVGESVDYYHLEAPNYLMDNMVVEGMVAETFGGKYKGKYVYYFSQKEGGLLRIPLESISNPRRLN